ncbi:hypothetical protein ACF0H5_009004 [Mactra antiquata]
MLKLIIVQALVGFCLATYHNVDRIQQNYDEKINSKIVQQIQYELKASYLYQAYSHYFGRADVALPGFAKWFEKASLEERKHATGLIDYVNKRGGQVSFSSLDYSSMCSELDKELSRNWNSFGRNEACICTFMSMKQSSCSDRGSWKNGLYAMQDTLALERFVNKNLLDLHTSAGEYNDVHLAHVLEHEYLDEQVEAIKSIGDFVRQLERVGDGLGEYLFDKDL